MSYANWSGGKVFETKFTRHKKWMLGAVVILAAVLCLHLQSASGADLQWNASVPDETHGVADGYRIHWGNSPGIYTGQADTGLSTTWHIPDDWFGQFYFAASAYNTAGQSGYSNEVLFTRNAPSYTGATGLRASRYQVERQNDMAVLVGYSDATVAATRTLVSDYMYYMQFTAVASGTATLGYARFATGATGHCKLAIYNSSGTLLGASNSTAIAAGTVEFAGLSEAITESENYILGIIEGDYTYPNLNLRDNSTTGPRYRSMAYASVGDVVPASDTTWSGYPCLWVEGSTSGASAVKGGRGNLGMLRGMSRRMYLESDFLKPIGGQ